MNLNKLSVLAVVPARGGSVGVPRKNLAKVGGLSLIARVSAVIRELPWITKAVLSTDDPEMKEEGVSHGLECPFTRPSELAGSKASGPDVLYHAWTTSETLFNTRYDYALYLEPTSPLRQPEDVERTLKTLIDSDYDSAVTVSPTPAHFAPEKCLTKSDDGMVGFYVKEGQNVHARQSLPRYFHRNGVAYAVRREPFFAHRRVINEQRTVAVVIDRPLVNIDEPFELELAEWLLSKAQH